MGYQCRCLTRIKGVKCCARKSLSKKPSEYLRQPQCPQCGQRHWYIDKYRIKVELDKKRTCDCGGYHFVHRKGSKYCHFNKHAEQNQTERYER